MVLWCIFNPVRLVNDFVASLPAAYFAHEHDVDHCHKADRKVHVQNMQLPVTLTHQEVFNISISVDEGADIGTSDLCTVTPEVRGCHCLQVYRNQVTSHNHGKDNYYSLVL